MVQREDNYQRALIWTAVMTALSHLDPAFSSVFAIEAVNEPTSDASKTPGYGECRSFMHFALSFLADHYTVQTHFVQVVRAVEGILGIYVPGISSPRTQGFRRSFSSRRHLPRNPISLEVPPLSGSFSAAIQTVSSVSWSPIVISVLEALQGLLPPLCDQLDLDTIHELGLLNDGTGYPVNREPLMTK